MSLREHYERKYSHESTASSIESISKVRTPTSRYEAVVKLFSMDFKGGDILELGAGNGNVAKTLLESDINIDSYTMGDISLPRIKGIKNNLSDSRLRILQIDAEDIPNGELGKYHAIIMVALIEHLIDPLRAMQKIRQLLKPGGFVYLDTPNIAKYTRRLKLLLGIFPSTASKNEGLTTYLDKPVDLYDDGHLHYFTYRSLSMMLTQRCGYSKVKKLGYPAGPMPLSRYMHNLLANSWPEMFSELAVLAYA